MQVVMAWRACTQSLVVHTVTRTASGHGSAHARDRNDGRVRARHPEGATVSQAMSDNARTRSIPASYGSASDLTVPHCKCHASNGPAQAHDPHALHASEHIQNACPQLDVAPVAPVSQLTTTLLQRYLHTVITTRLLQATLRRAKQLGLCTLNLVFCAGFC